MLVEGRWEREGGKGEIESDKGREKERERVGGWREKEGREGEIESEREREKERGGWEREGRKGEIESERAERKREREGVGEGGMC